MKKLLFLLILFSLFVGVVLLFSSESFESEPPTISAENEIYWNYKDPLKIKISDSSGIQNYRVYMNSTNENRLINSISPQAGTKELEVVIEPPKNTMFLRDGGAEIEIIVTDNAKWGFGNTATKKIRALIDTQRPEIQVITHSYKIVQGGAAFAVFKATDEHLESIVITNGERVFKPVYFAEGGYYGVLLAWGAYEPNFKASIQVQDKAGNISVASIPFYPVKRNYKVSTIKINDNLIDGKISDLILEVNGKTLSSFATQVDKFTYINKEIRAKNEEIVELIGQNFDRSSVLPTQFKLKKFYPLRNGAAVGRFGDHRYFSYQDVIVGESYHLGIDFASVKQAPILISNGGVVAYTGFNGIYGNIVIIDHGLGLMSLYAHMTEIEVQQGQNLKAGDRIGTTGLSGLVFGDHLHFGILVQGVQSNPSEWLDQKWINDNLFKVIKDAQNMIQ